MFHGIIDFIEFLFGVAATLGLAAAIKFFLGQKQSAKRFGVGTAIVLAFAVALELYARMQH